MKKILLLLICSYALSAQASIKEIDYAEAKRIYNAGSGLFIDARELKFYKKGTVLGALNIPLQRFRRLKRLLPAKKSSKLVLFCGGIKCGKSTALAKKILAEGYSRVMVYRGGFPEWSQKGQEVMLWAHYCRSAAPTPEPITIQGVQILPGSEKGMVDPDWFAAQFDAGTLPSGITLVDVRSPEDYRHGYLPHAINIPWDHEKGTIDSSRFPADKLVLLYCNTGMRSADAYESLDEAHAKQVLYLNAVIDCKRTECEIRPNRY